MQFIIEHKDAFIGLAGALAVAILDFGIKMKQSWASDGVGHFVYLKLTGKKE